jgi:hypothetical protein
VPIPGTTKLHRLEENIGGVNVELTADALREIDNLTAQTHLLGSKKDMRARSIRPPPLRLAFIKPSHVDIAATARGFQS